MQTRLLRLKYIKEEEEKYSILSVKDMHAQKVSVAQVVEYQEVYFKDTS
jgi:hypothetical protein